MKIIARIAGQNPRARLAFALFAPLVFYCALSFAFFGDTRSWTHSYFGYTIDPICFVWFLNWWPFALTHHLNPFICKYVWFPHGFNLSWATAIPSLALLSWPITALGGPILSFNILSLLAPALGAWSAFLLGREVSRNWAGALVGGYLFGFSGPEYNEILSELNLDTIFLIPLAVLLCVRRARGSLAQKPFITLLTLLLVTQIGISTEILTTLCLMGALTWIIFLISAAPRSRAGLWNLARDIGISTPFVILLASPFLFYLIQGLPDVPSIINSPVFASSELINFLFPGQSVRFGWPMIASLLGEFSRFQPNRETYIGAPLFLILVLYFSARIRLPHVRALLATTCFIAILSLGPLLHFNGLVTGIHLPWALALHLPLVRDILPARLIIYVTLCTAMATTLWLAEKSSIVGRTLRFALAGVACLILVPVKTVNLTPPWTLAPFLVSQHYFGWSPWPEQPFFTPQHIRAALGSKPNVLLLPAVWNGPNLAWQLNTGMTFTQSAVYIGFIPMREQGYGVVNDMISGMPQPGFGNNLTAYCAIHHINFILMRLGTPPAIADAIQALNWPRKQDDGVEIIRVPDPSKLKFLLTEGDYWPSSTSLSWMGKQMQIVSSGIPTAITLSGKSRPASGVVRVTVASQSTRTTFEIGQSTTQTIMLPANGSTTITASDTFVPNRIIHNGDKRNLSVLLSLIQPAK